MALTQLFYSTIYLLYQSPESALYETLAGDPAPPGIELTTSSSPSSIPPLPLTTLLNPIYFQLAGKKKIKNRLSDPPLPLKKQQKKHTHKDTTTPIPLTSSSCSFKSKQIKLTKKRKPFSMDQTHDLIILSSLLYKSKGRGGGGSARGLNSTPPSPSLLLPPPSHLNPFLATHELSSSSKKQISVLRV